MTTSEKIETKEVVELLQKITDGATGDKMPLTEILRLCMRLGKQLGNKELINWALAELNGYKNKEELPDYRIQGTEVYGHFSGPFQSGIRNAQIPKAFIEEEHRKNLFMNYLLDPIAELEQLSSGDLSETLHSPWSADVVAYYQRKEIYEGMVLSAAWRILTKASLKGILDTIRTRVLEFALKIEDELNIDKSFKRGERMEKPTPEKVSQIVQNTIYGANVSIGNMGGTIQQSIQIQPGDLEGLKKYLVELGLTKQLINDLEQALNEDSKAKIQPGPATSSWIARTMIMIGKGTLSVASNTVGSLIAAAVMKYLGL